MIIKPKYVIKIPLKKSRLVTIVKTATIQQNL